VKLLEVLQVADLRRDAAELVVAPVQPLGTFPASGGMELSLLLLTCSLRSLCMFVL